MIPPSQKLKGIPSYAPCYGVLLQSQLLERRGQVPRCNGGALKACVEVQPFPLLLGGYMQLSASGVWELGPFGHIKKGGR